MDSHDPADMTETPDGISVTRAELSKDPRGYIRRARVGFSVTVTDEAGVPRMRLAPSGPCEEGEDPLGDDESGQPVRILYTNHRGETALRTIVPRRIWFGITTWHPRPQWLLDALDVEKGEGRSFALADVKSWENLGDEGNPVAEGATAL